MKGFHSPPTFIFQKTDKGFYKDTILFLFWHWSYLIQWFVHLQGSRGEKWCIQLCSPLPSMVPGTQNTLGVVELNWRPMAAMGSLSGNWMRSKWDLNDQDSAFSQCSLGQIFLLVGNSNIPLPSAPSPALLNPHSQLSTISRSWVALSKSLGGGGGWGLLPQPWFFELSRVTNSTVLPKNGLALKEVCKDEKILRTHYLKKES